MASTRIYRTSGTPTNRKKFTISCWLKKCQLAGDMQIVNFYQDGSNRTQFSFNSSDQFDFIVKSGNSNTMRLKTTRLFRDVSAWYHIVMTVDTTQSTNTDRLKLYVNGEQNLSANNGFASETYPSQNADATVGGTHSIGAYDNGGSPTLYWDGLLAHLHYTDGYAYPASTFGETDSTSGIWVPKTNPSVTYGTNGFFFKFENSGNMDLDSSGNNLAFTTSGNLTQNIDTPSNNFATLNPLVYTQQSGTNDFGNRNFEKSSSVNRSCFSTLAPSSGKWYCEVKVFNNTDCKLGIADISANYNFNGQTLDFSDSTYGYSYNEAGTKSVAGNSSSYGTSYSNNDIIGIAMDLDNNKLYFSKNGTFENSGVPTSGSTGTGAIGINAGGNYAFCGKANGGTDLGYNFGSGDYSTSATVASSNADDNGIGSFEYDVPAGYYALCTKNIKEFG